MGQHPKWHAEQLNRYISDISKTIHSLSSLHNSDNHLTASVSANDKSGNVVQNVAYSSNSNSGTSDSSISLNNKLKSFNHPQLHNFSSSFVDQFSDAIHSALTTNLLPNNSAVAKPNDNEHDESILSNYWMLLLIVLYFFVVIGGIFGNASLIVSLFTQSSARLRNPLLVALCIADLMVTGIAAPLTVIALALDTITSALICKSIHFVQVIHYSNQYPFTINYSHTFQFRHNKFDLSLLSIVFETNLVVIFGCFCNNLLRRRENNWILFLVIGRSQITSIQLGWASSNDQST